jgi:hypothetical protein
MHVGCRHSLFNGDSFFQICLSIWNLRKTGSRI